jgi:hypothetical protein
MAGKVKKETLKGVGIKPLITVDPCLPSFDGHPYFERKVAAAKKLLKKVGLPKGLTQKASLR